MKEVIVKCYEPLTDSYRLKLERHGGAKRTPLIRQSNERERKRWRRNERERERERERVRDRERQKGKRKRENPK